MVCLCVHVWCASVGLCIFLQDESLARQVLVDVGGAVDLAVVELLQLMSLTDHTQQLCECDISYYSEKPGRYEV